jgi:hypothetical protein
MLLLLSLLALCLAAQCIYLIDAITPHYPQVLCVLSPPIIRNYSMLSAVAELDLTRLNAVVKNTIAYRKMHALDNLQSCIDDLGLGVADVVRIVDKVRAAVHPHTH